MIAVVVLRTRDDGLLKVGVQVPFVVGEKEVQEDDNVEITSARLEKMQEFRCSLCP